MTNPTYIKWRAEQIRLLQKYTIQPHDSHEREVITGQAAMCKRLGITLGTLAANLSRGGPAGYSNRYCTYWAWEKPVLPPYPHAKPAAPICPACGQKVRGATQPRD